MRTLLASACAGLASIALSVQANAAEFFVSSAVSDSLHAGNHNHAIWLPFFESIPGTPLNGNSEGSDFDFSPDGLFTTTAGSATMIGNIISQVNANYGFRFSADFTKLGGPGSGGPKKELKSTAYAPGGPIDPSTWEYYRMTGGSLIGTGMFEGINFSLSERPINNQFPLQVGEGANNKNGNFGGSAWFFATLLSPQCQTQSCEEIWKNIAGYARQNSLVGDINVDLVETPLPAGVLLFGTGLAGLASLRRRRKQA